MAARRYSNIPPPAEPASRTAVVGSGGGKAGIFARLEEDAKRAAAAAEAEAKKLAEKAEEEAKKLAEKAKEEAEAAAKKVETETKAAKNKLRKLKLGAEEDLLMA